MSDYFVYRIALPRKVEGVTVPNDDGTFSVYINSALPDSVQDAALEHELRHIENNHLYSLKPVRSAEREADGAIPNLFEGNAPGHIPLFTSLEAFRDYIIPFTLQEYPETEKFIKQSSGF